MPPVSLLCGRRMSFHKMRLLIKLFLISDSILCSSWCRKKLHHCNDIVVVNRIYVHQKQKLQFLSSHINLFSLSRRCWHTRNYSTHRDSRGGSGLPFALFGAVVAEEENIAEFPHQRLAGEEGVHVVTFAKGGHLDQMVGILPLHSRRVPQHVVESLSDYM